MEEIGNIQQPIFAIYHTIMTSMGKLIREVCRKGVGMVILPHFVNLFFSMGKQSSCWVVACAHLSNGFKEMTAVGFEPTPLRTGA